MIVILLIKLENKKQYMGRRVSKQINQNSANNNPMINNPQSLVEMVALMTAVTP